MPDSKLFNPDHLKHLCAKHGLRPSKKYGQNFLVDKNVIEKIIAAADVSPTDTVIEVGPGFGTLTFALLAKARRVISFEIERKLQTYWDEQIKKNNIKNLEIIWGNVLKEWRDPLPTSPLKGGGETVPGRAIVPPPFKEGVGGGLASEDGVRGWSGDSPGGGRGVCSYKVVANIPYQITAPLIRLFLESAHWPFDAAQGSPPGPPEKIVLMVQKEVGERISAKPGQMSVLAVATQYYADPKIVAIVPRDAFWPAPAVDSAILELSPKAARPLEKEDEKAFFGLVRAGFSSPRKFLVKNLSPVLDKLAPPDLIAIFTGLGLVKEARAQELSLENWVDLWLKIKDFRQSRG